jgi:hypothetical protein
MGSQCSRTMASADTHLDAMATEAAAAAGWRPCAGQASTQALLPSLAVLLMIFRSRTMHGLLLLHRQQPHDHLVLLLFAYFFCLFNIHGEEEEVPYLFRSVLDVTEIQTTIKLLRDIL